MMTKSGIAAGLLVASLLSGVTLPAAGASIADKVEMLGRIEGLKVETMRIVRRNDFLNIQAEVVNPTNDNQTLYYRFKWLDSAGFTVGGEETWKPLTIYGGQRKLIETVAPTQDVSDFRMELQSPNNSGVK